METATTTPLIYRLNDKPPFLTNLLLGFQHIFAMASTLIVPVVTVREIGGSHEQVASILCCVMIAIGLTTILQALNKGGIGSGFLCPHLSGPAYLAATTQAAWAGGLPLLFGMTAIAGLFEILVSRVIKYLRPLFPPEVTGVVVLMVGYELVPLGVTKFFGIESDEASFNPQTVIVAIITLLAMVGVNVWGKGKLRLYCVLVGLAVGYTMSMLLGELRPDDLHAIGSEPVVALPQFSHLGWAFNPSLLVPFLIASLCSTIKSMGDLMICQKINDENWRQPEMNSISRGVLAGGIGTFLSGLMGGMGLSTSSSNIGLSIATGATSRRIAFAAGGIFIMLAFFPKLAAVLSIMPSSVMGAILVFVTSFMVIAGIQIITSTAIDIRKTFIVGISMIFGISVDILPDIYTNIPTSIKPFFSTSLTLTAILAILLNLMFKIGTKSGK